MNKYAQIDLSTGNVTAYTETHSPISGANIVAAASAEACIGKRWEGFSFVDIVRPLRYKVWSKTAFVTVCGQAVYDAIVDGNSKPLRYFKYILDSSDFVDLNNTNYFAMVAALNNTNPKIMSDAIFAALTVQE